MKQTITIQPTKDITVIDIETLSTVTTIPVDPPLNKPPIVTAGSDKTITLPTNQVILTAVASDPEGGALTYQWTKVSGGNVTFASPKLASTLVSGLQEGGYTFRISTTDPQGAKTTDDINVTVKPAVDVPPANQTFPLTFTDLVGDYARPGAGIEQWHSANEVNVYGATLNDVYYRFPATRLEGATQGSYNWSYFDSLVNAAISKKQKFSFGIMTVYPEGNTSHGLASYDGGTSCYPQWLHNAMQAESVKDWRQGNTWIPNYNSEKYLGWVLARNKAIDAHIKANGWQKVINFIDIRSYGSWGEWHHGSLVGSMSEFPSGTRATTATLKKIIDCYTQGFPDFQLVGMIAAFDANRLPMIMNPPEVGWYMLTAKNNVGVIGWRRDQWGATDSYLSDYLENNNATWNGVVLKTLIMDKWKFAPITGEPPSWSDDNYNDLVRQIKLYHANSFGNGNYGVALNTTIINNVKAAAAAAGYRITLKGGQVVVSGSQIAITLNWDNSGRTWTYDIWNVVFELTGTNSKTSTSAMPLRLFTGAKTQIDTITGMLDGTYKLNVKIVDPTGYRNPMPLGITGKNSDGSYTLVPALTVKK